MKKIPKERQLLTWARRQKVFNTTDVARWGIQNYFTSARRTIRRFVRSEIFLRLSKNDLKTMKLDRRVGDPRIAWYMVKTLG